jgi:phage shock protein E
MYISNLFKRSKKANLLHPKTYKKMIEEKAIVLLDVRTQSEFEHAHIPNAILFPISRVEQHIETYFPNKQLTYVIYCRSGIRSHSALLIMKQLGYDVVYDMGGIIDWPYEITTKKSESK